MAGAIPTPAVSRFWLRCQQRPSLHRSHLFQAAATPVCGLFSSPLSVSIVSRLQSLSSLLVPSHLFSHLSVTLNLPTYRCAESSPMSWNTVCMERTQPHPDLFLGRSTRQFVQDSQGVWCSLFTSWRRDQLVHGQPTCSEYVFPTLFCPVPVTVRTVSGTAQVKARPLHGASRRVAHSPVGQRVSVRVWGAHTTGRSAGGALGALWGRDPKADQLCASPGGGRGYFSGRAACASTEECVSV